MNLNDMTVSELRKLAAEYSITGRSTMKKADLVAAIEAAYAAADAEAGELLDAVLGTEAGTIDAEAVEAATKEHEDEEIDLTSTIDTMIGGWLEPVEDLYREVMPMSDHNPDTEGRPTAIDVSSDCVPVRRVRNVNVEIERDPRGGRMMYVFEEDGDMQSIRLVKRGRRWETVVDRNYSRFAVKAATLPKLVKAWAKKSGAWATQIDITI